MKKVFSHFLFLMLLLCCGKATFSQQWKQLNDSLISYYKEGDYNKALMFAEKAKIAAESEFGKTHINYHKSLTNLAIVFDKKGMLTEAESIRKKSVEISKLIFGENSLEYATAFNQLALLYEKLKNINMAESSYLSAISILKKQTPADELLISVLYNLADFYQTNYQNTKAIETYEQWENAISLIKGESYLENPEGFTSFAILYKNTGQYSKAEPLFYRAMEILKKTLGEEHPDYASSLNNLAGLYKDIGLYEKAEPLYIEALAIWKKAFGENHSDYAGGLNNMAVLYELMGQYDKAKMLYVQSIQIKKKTLGENDPSYASSLNNLAALLDNMGENEQAEQLFLQAKEIIKRVLGERNRSYPTCLNNLGGLYEKMGEYTKAEMLYRESAEIRKDVLGENHPDYASSISNLSILYTRLGDYAKAEPLYIQSKKIREIVFGQKHPEYAEGLSNFAMFYLTTGQYEKAQVLFSEATKIETTNLLTVFNNLSEREKGNFLTNNFFLNSSTNSLAYHYQKAPRRFYQESNDLQLFLKSLSLASTKNIMDVARNSSDTTIQKTFISWQMNKSILAKQFSLPIASRRVDLKQVEEQTESLEKELTRKSSAFKNRQQALQIKTTDLQKNLKKNEVAIEFVRFQLYTKLWTDSIIYAAYILRENDSIPVFIPLCEEKQLQEIFDSAGTNTITMVANFYRGLELGNTSSSRYLGEELYKLIWQPLEPYLKGIKKIAYSPAGKLYSIAFQALPVDSKTVLMDKYDLQQYTSTRQVALRNEEKQTVKPTDIVLFGNASFSMDSISLAKNKTGSERTSTTIYTPKRRSEENGTWSSLPGTAEEVKKIKTLFDQNKISTKSFTTTTATEESLKALDGRSPQILHIATHGFFLPDPEKKKKEMSFGNENTYSLADDPLLRSGLILAGGNYAWSGKTPVEGVEDGIATAYEISQLNLSNTELVVLSACETALGDVKGSEGVFGLQRAFKMAGVKKMIVSLWQVPDKETAELMTAFYGYWLKGKTIEQSFAQAQTDMRKKYSPYYWAAFVLVE